MVIVRLTRGREEADDVTEDFADPRAATDFNVGQMLAAIDEAGVRENTIVVFAGAEVPTDRLFDSLDQSDFILGKTDRSALEAFPIWCADRLQAVKWRNWKLHFMRQDTMFDRPVKNPVPTINDLYTDPREKQPTVDSWVVGPVLKVVGEFGESVKRHPLIPMGTPDPYRPEPGNPWWAAWQVR